MVSGTFKRSTSTLTTRKIGVDSATNRPHRILLYTLTVSGTGNSKNHKIVDDVFQFGGRDRTSCFLSIDRFYTDYKRRSLKLIHSLSREANPRTQIYRISSQGTVRFLDNSDICISAATCNGLQLLWSPNLAVKYWNRLVRNNLLFERTGSLSRRIRDFLDAAKHHHQDEVTLHGAGPRSPTLGLLLSLDPGVYAATLEGLQPIMHSVCISTIHSTVLDYIEALPLRLCAGTVKVCTGADRTFVGVYYLPKFSSSPLLRRNGAELDVKAAAEYTRRPQFGLRAAPFSIRGP